MKMRKEVLYFPLFLGAGYVINYLFLIVIGSRELVFLREYLFLVLVGIFIGLERLVSKREEKSNQFDPARFCFTVLPLFILLGTKLGIYLSIRTNILGEGLNHLFSFIYLKAPYPIYQLLGMSVYEAAGAVLLAYFAVTSFSVRKQALPAFEQKEEKADTEAKEQKIE